MSVSKAKPMVMSVTGIVAMIMAVIVPAMRVVMAV